MATEPLVHNRFDLDAGSVVLDFANTLEGRYDDPPRDLLHAYGDLLAFALESEIIDQETARSLSNEAARRSDEAAAVLAGALELREAIFDAFSALAAESEPPGEGLAVISGWLARALPHGTIAQGGDAFVWEWESPTTDLARPLWPIAYVAAELLLHGPTDRVRECAADDCGWLFVDSTRNRARRWCSMKSCGNRAKVQHFRERSRRE
jgi:predicted RNA-binding Zn ribbon-like protein